MGSKISKAVRRPDVKAAASVAPAPSHHDVDPTNEHEPRQDPAPQLLRGNSTVLEVSIQISRDDLHIATSTTPIVNNTAPARSMSFDATSNMAHANLQYLVESFEQFLQEQRLRNIEHEAGAPLPLPPPPPVVQPQHPQTVQPPPIPGPQCLICCKSLPQEKDTNYTKEAIKPCRSCKNDYCISCVKKVFINACRDSTRMPPRCCIPINLHVARPYLTEEEVKLFRQKYEEWSTPNPMYCPIPVCSTFIPGRLLPHNIRTKDKQRLDSGIGTPSAVAFACPACEANICVECRQVAHPGSICSMNKFGLDAKTAALLKDWGYKKCPKCGHGVKRMFGCNHMECRCGSHFCWVCLENIEECDGGCNEEDEDDYDSDAEPDEDEDDDDPRINRIDNPPAPTVEGQATNTETADAATQAVILVTEGSQETATSPQEISRPRNLDGGSARYWANTELNFGDEPSNDIQDRAWDCRHYFVPYKVPFATAITSHAADMECVKCWNIIHPEIEAPKGLVNAKEKVVSVSAGRERVFRERGGVFAARGATMRARYEPPRGLYRTNATIGTAPHLTTTISSLSQSVLARESSPMEDVQLTERVVDTYGNVITATSLMPQQRASLDMSLDTIEASREAFKNIIPGNIANTSRLTSDIFPATSALFSLAHECCHCQILVCATCKATAVTAQEEKEKQAKKLREAEDEDPDDDVTLTLPLPDPESDETPGDDNPITLPLLDPESGSDDDRPPPPLFD